MNVGLLVFILLVSICCEVTQTNATNSTATNSTEFVLNISTAKQEMKHLPTVGSQLQNDSKFADPPFNLSVKLNTRKQDKSFKIIATIHWNSTNDNRRRHYELAVQSVDALSSRCGRYFHRYDTSVSPNGTFYVIPSVTNQEIKQGCSYNVSLSSVPPSPMKNEKFTISTSFKADECINGNCRCSKNPFPGPSNITVTTAEVQDGFTSMAFVSWTYPIDRKDIDHFLIELWEQILSTANTSMHKKQLTKNVTYNSKYSNYSTWLIVANNRNYTIQVAAVDVQHCQVSVNKSLSVYGITYPGLHPVGSYIFLLLIVACCIIITLVTAIVIWNKRQRSVCRDCTVQYRHTSNCYSTNSASHLIDSDMSIFSYRQDLTIMSQHFNINYVEKEIQEARDIGLVDLYEIHEGRLQIGQVIGKGAFGRVYKARAESIAGIPGQIVVAVKCLRENSNAKEKEDFLAEISMMKKAGRHPNVIAMLGCCTLKEPFCMIMEYIAFGDLLNYLWKLRAEYESTTGVILGLTSVTISGEHKLSKQGRTSTSNEINSSRKKSTESSHKVEENPDESYCEILHFKDGSLKLRSGLQNMSDSSKNTEETSLCGSGENIDGENLSEQQFKIALDTTELQQFAHQIASGMAHLASRGIVHRDLAARNILIDLNKVLKISDFGLSRSGIYVTHRGGRVPLRWLSLEAIRDNLYSTESDVWAFAVVLWEICTLGGFPYSSISDKELFGQLLKGHRLERPINCSENLYTLMNSCWRHNPQQRPTFHELRETLKLMGEEPHTYVNFDMSNTMAELPPIQGKEIVC